MKRHFVSIAGLAMVAVAIAGCEATRDFSDGVRDSVGDIFSRDEAAARGTVVAAPSEVASTATSTPLSDGGAPFSSAADVAYAAVIWDAMHNDYFVGRDAIQSHPYPGNMPHGEQLEILTSHARINGHEGMLIIKKNYLAPEGGEGITAEDVANDPDAYLDAVTIMFQREAGYDSENADWFWAKYAPDGTVMTNPAGMSLAGRVARGMDTGCIACHLNAPGGDYVFSHDRVNQRLTGN